MPDALTAGFESTQRAAILERQTRGPDHIHREDLQYLTDDQLTALHVRAYGAWMKIEVCNTAAISGRYRPGLRWRTMFGWCESERERREAASIAAE